jgi:hypothetical protein
MTITSLTNGAGKIMFEQLQDIEALLGNAVESVSLEFKSGLFFNGFTRDPGKRSELIKDVTGLANAGGGAIIYGIRERREGADSIAEAFEPVPAGAVTRDQLTQLIHGNTDPPLAGFRVTPFDVEGGQIIVVEVDEGYTATQNKLDYLFYQRVEATNVRMGGYAIRDVMNRRTTPIIEAGLQIRSQGIGVHRHNYLVIPRLRNTGAVTAAHWRLFVEIPSGVNVQLDMQAPMLVIGRDAVHFDGRPYERYEYSSERNPPLTSLRLLPGEEMLLSQNRGFPGLLLEVNEAVARQALRGAPPLRWTLHVDNTLPARGEVSYEDWCQW